MRSLPADKTRPADGDPVERLRASGIVGFFRPAQLADAGLARNQLRGLLRSGTIEMVGGGLCRLLPGNEILAYLAFHGLQG